MFKQIAAASLAIAALGACNQRPSPVARDHSGRLDDARRNGITYRFSSCMQRIAPFNASNVEQRGGELASILILPVAETGQFSAEASLVAQMPNNNLLSVFTTNTIINGPPTMNPRPTTSIMDSVSYTIEDNGTLTRAITRRREANEGMRASYTIVDSTENSVTVSRNPSRGAPVDNGPRDPASQWSGFGRTGLLSNSNVLAAADNCARQAFGAQAVVIAIPTPRPLQRDIPTPRPLPQG